MRVALVGCVELPEPDPDEQPLLRALWDEGIEAEVLGWDDPLVDPSQYDACLLRATWNYPWVVEPFKSWVKHAGSATRLVNPADVVKWNIDKKYLLELEEAGVPVVPSTFVGQGEPADVSEIAESHGWGRFVIKPAVSAGSYLTRLFGSSSLDEAQAFLNTCLRERDMMIQEYRPEVEQGGERALVWIGGELTHSIVKDVRFADHEERVRSGKIGDDERAMCEWVLGAVPFELSELLYARVDVIRTEEGIMLSELELIEPSLYFDLSKRALARYVSCVKALA